MMPRAIRLIALCVLVTCVAGGSTAVAANASARRGDPTIRLKKIGVSSTPVYTDGTRWAVYEPTVGVTRIMDTITATSTAHSDPEGCAGGLLAMGGGEILYACSDPECPGAQDACVVSPIQTVGQPYQPTYENARLVVQDIPTGVQHAVAGENHIVPVGNPDTGGPDAFGAVGSQWLVGAVSEYHGGGLFFLNWHTGRVLQEQDEPKNANQEYENLNSPTLLMPLCKPLMRRVAPVPLIGFYPHYFLSQYASPFMLEEQFSRGNEAAEGHHRIYLKRCGSKRKELLPELEGVGGVQLSSTILTDYRHLWWLDSNGHYWLGQTYRLSGPGKLSGREVGHTSKMVFETIEQPGASEAPFRNGVPSGRGPGHYVVWVARLPRVGK